MQAKYKPTCLKHTSCLGKSSRHEVQFRPQFSLLCHISSPTYSSNWAKNCINCFSPSMLKWCVFETLMHFLCRFLFRLNERVIEKKFWNWVLSCFFFLIMLYSYSFLHIRFSFPILRFIELIAFVLRYFEAASGSDIFIVF